MRSWTAGLLALLAVLAFTTRVHAQGGGASSTGTIQGRISDPQGALLAGVTVTTTSPSALGAQTTITSETGNYRFPAIPPGTYELTYALAGFTTLKRTGIINTVGFTTNLNVELALAIVEETVTVHGDSPIIDTSATSVVQVFKLDQLQSIPGRDMWSLLAATPGVGMARIDVAGSRAGTQTAYTAYGYAGQVRVLIDGINTTEGTGGAGFYFDYSSLEEVFIGVQGQSAEMPNPGVQSQFVARSGGNRFSGEYYVDFNNNAMQGSNIPDAVIAGGIRPHSNEMERYYDTSIGAGGPLKKDRLWWFASYRRQQLAIAQPQFQFDKTSDTTLWNPVAKGTWQINQRNKLIGYYQWGQKVQPNRLTFATYSHPTPGETFAQDSGAWVYKAEWIGTLSDKLYVEARYGTFGYYFPLIANSDDQYFWRDTGLQTLIGAGRKTQLDRDRKQWTGAATYFLDTGTGSHAVKFGAELLKEQSWEGTLQQWGGNIEHQYANGASSTVVFGLPTATKVNSLTANDEGALTARAALDHLGMFVTDTWAIGRFTVIGGLRLDRYRGWLPEQRQLAATVGPVSVAAKTFPEKEFYTWTKLAPRVGVVYDLSGDGKTVVKASYGFFWHSPGIGVSNDGNPNTANKSATYTWSDRNGDRQWQPGEEGPAPTSASLEGSLSVDPNLTAPYSHDAGIFFEQQLGETMGLRTGFVYKTEDNLDRPIPAGSKHPEWRLQRAVRVCGCGRRRRTRNERRPQPDAVRHAGRTGGQLPDRSRRDECPALLTIQDGRALATQAVQQQAVVPGRRRLLVDDGFPGRLPTEPEPGGRLRSHRLGRQGDRNLRRAVGDSRLTSHQASVGRQLRTPDQCSRERRNRIRADAPGQHRLRRSGQCQP